MRTNWCGAKDHQWNPNRRDFLFVGATGLLGLTLPQLLQADEAKKIVAKAKSVISIYLPGGIAHQESWDPKFLAPIEYRGPLDTVNTVLTGERFSENLVHTAKIADKITVIRSMHHGQAAHERGTESMLTGYRPSPALTYPSMGSVVSKELGIRNNLPPYVQIPSPVSEFSGPGYLSQQYSGFSINSDPASPGYRVRDLTLPVGVSQERFATRKSMLEAVDAHFYNAHKNEDRLAAMDSFYQKAFTLLDSPKARSAFDLTEESVKTKEQYGLNAAGQRMLLARRLIEGGVRFVTLTYGGWDHHDGIKTAINRQLPAFDQAFSALITDLDQRGLLDETLVLVTSEFGRTPKINGTAGRDHWPGVFSIVMAGGGVKRGYVHGSSDSTGAQPDQDPLTVENFAATTYSLVGIDPNKHLVTPDGRPVTIVYNGAVEQKLLA